VTREVANDLYDGEVRFSNAWMGKHQYLPNGNVLIVTPENGRAIEVTSRGDRVMEFNNLARGAVQYNAHLENGRWYPPDYFVKLPACP